jgi:hypothetical protein
MIAPSPAQAAATSEYANTHSIAIISALGNDIDMQTYGFVIFDFSGYKLHTDWNIDQQVVDLVTRALSGKYVIKNVPIDSKSLADIREPLLGTIWPDVEHRIASLPQTNGVDAYVVVVPQLVKNVGEQWQGLVGTRSPGLVNDGKTDFGAYYLIGVFDSRTGRRIDFGTARIPASPVGHNPPVAECPKSMWPNSEEQITPQQNASIHVETVSLISRSIAYTLASANLISDDDAAAVTKQIGLPGAPSCHEPTL